LLFRRTTTLGALVMCAVMTNVVMLNFCYDVPVKLNSSHWLMMAVFLLLPEVPRLLNVFVLHRATQPATVGVPVRGKRWRIGWVVAKAAFVAWMLYSAVEEQIEFRKQSPVSVSGPLAGVYEVESFRYNGEELPPLGDSRRWQRVYVEGSHALAVRTPDEKWAGYEMTVDEAGRRLTLKGPGRSDQGLSWCYEQAGDGLLLLEGSPEGASVSVRLKKIDRNRFSLVQRGFHWVNEAPPNW
jgi:hypothetical protein